MVSVSVSFTHMHLICLSTDVSIADKELWEPIIQHMLELDSKGPVRRIRDAWSLDWQSHGEAGLLNRRALNEREPVCTNITIDGRVGFLTLSYSGRRIRGSTSPVCKI
jgi:hypothetical protein